MYLIKWFVLVLITINMVGCAAKDRKMNTQYDIGITEIDFTVASGKKLHAYIWYPTQNPSGKKDYLTSKALQEEMSIQFGMPKFSISTKETTNAHVDSPIIAGKLPVVFFSHGFASFARQNNKLMEHYAKNGLIVVVISNPKESLVTEYTNGELIKIDRNTTAMQTFRNKSKKQLKEISTKLSNDFMAVKQAQNPTDYVLAMKNLGVNDYFESMAPYVKSGSENLIQSIQVMKENSFGDEINNIIDSMDFSKLILMGHSLGGLISINANRELAKDNNAAKLLIGLDSPAIIFDHQNVELNDFYHSPICVYQGGFTKLSKLDFGITGMNDLSVKHSQFGGCILNTQKAHHNNYTDMTNVGILKWFGLIGKVNGKKFGQWMNESSLDVIEHYLYNEPNAQLNLSSNQTKESKIEVFHAR